MASSTTTASTYSHEIRAEEKRQSRLQDARDLTSGRKSVEDLRRENSAFKVTGERIDYNTPLAAEW